MIYFNKYIINFYYLRIALKMIANGQISGLAHKCCAFLRHNRCSEDISCIDNESLNKYRTNFLEFERKRLSRSDSLKEQHTALLAQKDLNKVEYFLYLYLLVCTQGKQPPVLLIIDHEEGGGANTYSGDLIQQEKFSRPVIRLTWYRRHEIFRISFFFKEYCENIFINRVDVLENFLSLTNRIDFFYNNLVFYKEPEKVLEMILKFLKAGKARLTVALHDYFPVCPSYVLLDNNGRYCNIQNGKKNCSTCLPYNRFAAISHVDISIWRTLWSSILQAAEKILIFSHSSQEILSSVYKVNTANIQIVPHGLRNTFARKPAVDLSCDLHIGVVGGINEAKGAGVVADLVAEMDKRRYGHLTIIGQLADVTVNSKRCHVTGRYEVDDLPELIENSGANIFLVPSVWPETFNYTVSELIALEVPVICFNLGAPPERVRTYEKGMVLAPNLPSSTLLDKLENFRQTCIA